MRPDLKSTNGLIVAMVGVAAVVLAFWLLALSPKREEAAELDKQVTQLESSIALHQSEITQGEEARRQFPVDYQRLVVLGKAVPGDDDVASLLVQISRIAETTDVEFLNLKLAAEGGEAEAAAAAAPSPGAEPVSATEAEASLLPLGASIGPAGLAVMPYTLTFKGNFFTIADFIEELDSLVKTTNEDVSVDGRLITVDAFTLVPDSEKGFPALEVSFGVTTYVMPPQEEVTASATPAAPESATGTPASATIGETP
jgi:Tfp pilus assembly protein PilO